VTKVRTVATSTHSDKAHEASEQPLHQEHEPSGRDERPRERLDRNEVELISELRVAAAGIQVLLAFLLIVPFNSRWSDTSKFDHYVYFVTLLCMVAAAALLIAPTVHHRVLFRRDQKEYLVELGNRSAIVAMALLTLGWTGIMVLISNVLFGGVVPIVVGVATLLGVATLWFGIPLRHMERR
jgi:Family of unknown function (DUF6328)